MKTRFVSHALATLAVVVAGALIFSLQGKAGETTSPSPANSSALPPEIQPGTPAAEVIKLVQAGVDESVIKAYVSNSTRAFNLDADKIISLSDAGLPGDVINDMIVHDKNYLASLYTEPNESEQAQPAQPTNTSESRSVTEPPPTEVTVNYFYDNLAPYGSWVNVDGYGRCWRPNVVLYDATWRPYCDRGHWVYTDYGWYWDSDYSWGITFHYGRWFNSPSYGWCWWPDTVWAPSWVTWRSTTDYCGWAPLPPLTVYQPGIGFYYRGKTVSIGFNFGLAASCYTFISPAHFCDPRPRNYCVPTHQVNRFYHQTTVINNFNCNKNRIINNGVSVTVIGRATRHPIQPVSIGSLVNPGRRVWHGTPSNHHFYGTDATEHSNNHSAAAIGARHENDHPANSSRHDYGGNKFTGNNNRNTHNRPQSFASTAPTENRDNHKTFWASRDEHDSFSRPSSTITVTTRKPELKTSPAQNQSHNNNWSFSGHQTPRPESHPSSSSASGNRNANPGNWANRNMVRNESRPTIERPSQPHYQMPANNRPVVIGQGSQHYNSHQSAGRVAPRIDTPHNVPSASSPQPSQRQQIGGPRNWSNRNR